MLQLNWWYNGVKCYCPYRCPACYGTPEGNDGHHFTRDIETWMRAFDEKLPERCYFIFAWGEPPLGEQFLPLATALLEKHVLHVISNMCEESQPVIDELCQTANVKNLRMYSSWHPTQATPRGQTWEMFMAHHERLRDTYGLQIGISYIAWPPILYGWEECKRDLDRRGFTSLLIRYIGDYKGQWYPKSYTPEERAFVVRYLSTPQERFCLNCENVQGQMCYAGTADSSVTLDTHGNIFRCVMSSTQNPAEVADRVVGNIFDDDFALYDGPRPCAVPNCGSLCAQLNFPPAGVRDAIYSDENFVIAHLRRAEWPEGREKPWLP